MKRTSLAALLLGLLLCGALAQSGDSDSDAGVEDEEDYEEEVPDRGFLVIRKKLVEADIVQGKAFTVQLSLHNAGSRHAHAWVQWLLQARCSYGRRRHCLLQRGVRRQGGGPELAERAVLAVRPGAGAHL